jgi:hypothetical protein
LPICLPFIFFDLAILFVFSISSDDVHGLRRKAWRFGLEPELSKMVLNTNPTSPNTEQLMHVT